MKNLHFYTMMYPYGSQETFIENEMSYLSDSFDNVYINPLYKKYEKYGLRHIPDNIIINDFLLPDKYINRFLKSLFCFSFSVHKAYFDDFFLNRVYLNWDRFYSWFASLTNTKCLFVSHKKKIEMINSGIVYLYWGKYILNLIPFINKNKNVMFVCRLHRGDIYLDETGYSPIKKKAMGSVDFFIPISFDVKKYINKIYDVPFEKIELSKLGTKIFNNKIDLFHQKSSECIRVVSCSNIVKVKRVDLIVDILSCVKGVVVEWHHFGDGNLFDDILRKTFSLSDNIIVNFHGRVSNEELISFYLNNYVDVFMNVSKSEGVPVSMMEAMSFGIPVIATDVGGVNELINNDNGILLNVDFDVNFVSEIIKSVKKSDWVKKRERAFSYWDENYNAGKNYPKLISFFESIYNVNE